MTNLGLILLQQEKYDVALEKLHKAVQVYPNSLETNLNLANALAMDKGRFGSAQRFYRRALAIDPNDAGAHADPGRCYYAGGIFQEAMEQYRQAIGIDPGWDKPRIELAKAYWISNKTDQAMEELKALKRSDPKAGIDLEAWFRHNPPQHSNKP